MSTDDDRRLDRMAEAIADERLATDARMHAVCDVIAVGLAFLAFEPEMRDRLNMLLDLCLSPSADEPPDYHQTVAYIRGRLKDLSVDGLGLASGTRDATPRG